MVCSLISMFQATRKQTYNYAAVVKHDFTVSHQSWRLGTRKQSLTYGLIPKSNCATTVTKPGDSLIQSNNIRRNQVDNHLLSRNSDLARRPTWYVPFTHGVLQKDKYRHRVICPGIAASMGLRCSGRRNALGSVVGRRLCPYFSGTSAILAKLTKSNTNVQSPYRLPILECTHDKDCTSTKCLSPKVTFYCRGFI